MDVTVVKTENGKRYNQFDEEIIDCQWCGGPTTMKTECCDGCYELSSRISGDIKLAEKMLKHYKNGGE